MLTKSLFRTGLATLALFKMTAPQMPQCGDFFPIHILY